MGRREDIDYHCWVTNCTNMKIVLSDLRFTLQPNKTIDILDYRHSNLSIKDVQTSIEQGSIYKKWKVEKKIIIKQSEPKPDMEKKIELSKVSFPHKYRKYEPVKETYFKELDLNFDVVEFANLNADASEQEHEPQINLRKLATLNNKESSIEHDDENQKNNYEK